MEFKEVNVYKSEWKTLIVLDYFIYMEWERKRLEEILKEIKGFVLFFSYKTNKNDVIIQILMVPKNRATDQNPSFVDIPSFKPKTNFRFNQT